MVQIHPDPPIFRDTLVCFVKDIGAIAQLGERLPCTQEVSGSIPLSSTIFFARFVGKKSELSICTAGTDFRFFMIGMLFNNLEKLIYLFI